MLAREGEPHAGAVAVRRVQVLRRQGVQGQDLRTAEVVDPAPRLVPRQVDQAGRHVPDVHRLDPDRRERHHREPRRAGE